MTQVNIFNNDHTALADVISDHRTNRLPVSEVGRFAQRVETCSFVGGPRVDWSSRRFYDLRMVTRRLADLALRLGRVGRQFLRRHGRAGARPSIRRSSGGRGGSDQ